MRSLAVLRAMLPWPGGTRAGLLALCVLSLAALPAFAASEDDAAIAASLAEMLRDARTIVSNNQSRINDPEVGDKGLTGQVVLDPSHPTFPSADRPRPATAVDGHPARLGARPAHRRPTREGRPGRPPPASGPALLAYCFSSVVLLRDAVSGSGGTVPVSGDRPEPEERHLGRDQREQEKDGQPEDRKATAPSVEVAPGDETFGEHARGPSMKKNKPVNRGPGTAPVHRFLCILVARGTICAHVRACRRPPRGHEAPAAPTACGWPAPGRCP